MGKLSGDRTLSSIDDVCRFDSRNSHYTRQSSTRREANDDTMRYIKKISAFFIVALLLFSNLPVQAADYTITITDSGVLKNQESIFSYDNVNTDDEFLHNIKVSNKDNKAYVIHLKKVEAVKTGSALDKMTFTFSDSEGSEKISFTKDDFDTLGNPELYTAAKNSDGSFVLRMKIGNLKNEDQGTSITIRYTFEVIQLYGGGPVTGVDFQKVLVICVILAVWSFIILLYLIFKKRSNDAKEERAYMRKNGIPEMEESKQEKEDVLPAPPHKTTGKKVKQIILNVLLALSVLLFLFVAISALFFSQKDAYLFGYKPYIITSESMEPVYMKRCIVLIKKGSYDQVEVGDVIAFKAHKIGGQPAFHRVIEITNDGFTTKGDAAKHADEQTVTRDDFLGSEVYHTNILPKFLILTQSPQGIIMFIVLPILLCAAIVVTIIFIVKTSKKKDE